MDTAYPAIVSTARFLPAAAPRAPLRWRAVLHLAAVLVATVAMQTASAHASLDGARAEARHDAYDRRDPYDRAHHEHQQHWLTYARLRTHVQGARHEEIALPPDTRALRLIAVHRRTDIIAAFVQYPDGRRQRLVSLEGAVNGSEDTRARLTRPACRESVLHLIHRSARDGKRATYDLLVRR